MWEISTSICRISGWLESLQRNFKKMGSYLYGAGLSDNVKQVWAHSNIALIGAFGHYNLLFCRLKYE
jgi:hypothetical protein